MADGEERRAVQVEGKREGEVDGKEGRKEKDVQDPKIEREDKNHPFRSFPDSEGAHVGMYLGSGAIQSKRGRPLRRVERVETLDA
jgi:hypothetical protein